MGYDVIVNELETASWEKIDGDGQLYCRDDQFSP